MGWASLGRRLSRYVRSELGSQGRRIRSRARRRGRRGTDQQASPEEPRAESTGPSDRIAGYYANLEIPNGSDLKTVKGAYRELMKRYHPDRHVGKSEADVRISNELAGKLTEAYEALKRHLGVPS